MTRALFLSLLEEEMAKLPQSERLEEARGLFESLVLAEEFTEFLTIPAYARIA